MTTLSQLINAAFEQNRKIECFTILPKIPNVLNFPPITFISIEMQSSIWFTWSVTNYAHERSMDQPAEERDMEFDGRYNQNLGTSIRGYWTEYKALQKLNIVDI